MPSGMRDPITYKHITPDPASWHSLTTGRAHNDAESVDGCVGIITHGQTTVPEVSTGWCFISDPPYKPPYKPFLGSEMRPVLTEEVAS